MIDNEYNTIQNEHTHETMIPCKKCGGRIFKIKLSKDLITDIEKFPFAIISMHVSHDGMRRVHTLVAYIDRNFKCRHVEVLSGKRLFITPYILYNPNLLFLSCSKNLGNFDTTQMSEENDGK
jgi:hypothetical protein